MNDWEIKIVQYFNRLGGKRLDDVLRLINSIIFLAFFWVAMVTIAVLMHPGIAQGFLLSVFIVAALHFIITEGIIKHLLTRVIALRKRPYVAYPDLIRPIGRKFSDSSFPSSHMATTAAMLVVISGFYPSLLFPAVVLVLVMAFSRLHNGMHYPSDIIVGTGLGFGYGFLALHILGVLF